MENDLANLESQLHAILIKAAEQLNIKNYDIQIDLISNRAYGIMADVYSASITDKSTNKKTKVVIKKAPTGEYHREACLIEKLFKTEIYFYSQIYSKLKNLTRMNQEEPDRISDLSFPLPEYIVSECEVGNEMIVFKDLEAEGYEKRNKHLAMDENYVRVVFAAYGSFHALSFYLKNEHVEEFHELLKPLGNPWKDCFSDKEFLRLYQDVMKTSIDETFTLKKHFRLKRKLKKHLTKFPTNFLTAITYRGNYGCLLHGDSWLSMFKYRDQEKTEAESVKLLDFQNARYGSLAHDLSYFLFLEASDFKPNINHWKSLLNVYYEAFSNTARQLGKRPQDLLPKRILRYEWKKYAKSSMILSMLVLKTKYASDEDIQQYNHALRTNPESIDANTLVKVNYDKELFTKRFVNIVQHLYNIKVL